MGADRVVAQVGSAATVVAPFPVARLATVGDKIDEGDGGCLSAARPPSSLLARARVFEDELPSFGLTQDSFEVGSISAALTPVSPTSPRCLCRPSISTSSSSCSSARARRLKKPPEGLPPYDPSFEPFTDMQAVARRHPHRRHLDPCHANSEVSTRAAPWWHVSFFSAARRSRSPPLALPREERVGVRVREPRAEATRAAVLMQGVR